MISGTLDPVSHNGKQLWGVAGKFKKAELTDITVVLVEGKRHELLNEINREETFELIINWMEKK